MSEREDGINVRVSLPPALLGPNTKRKSSAMQFHLTKDAKIQTVFDVMCIAEETRYLTNVLLEHNGVTKTPETPLKELEKSGEVELRVGLAPYTTKEALKHVLALRDLIGFANVASDDVTEFAMASGSSFFNMSLEPVKDNTNSEISNGKEHEDQESKANDTKRIFNVTEEEKKKFAQVVSEIGQLLKAKPSVSQIMNYETNIVTPCVQSICLDAYNPVPAQYRSQGHLLYLQIVTLEGETFHVTVIPSGFYVNKSTSTRFDPTSRTSEGEFIHPVLHGLIATHSKKYTTSVENLNKKLAGLDPVVYVRPSTTFLHKPWLVPTTSNSADFIRLQLSHYDNSAERDFNDEFQATEDITGTDIASRLEAERLKTKIIHDFNTFAVKGAMTIFHGDMYALNPEAPLEQRIFLKNNIFYSFICDSNGNYSQKGGDEAAVSASNQDLMVVNIMNRVNLGDIRHLLTAIIDCGGKRLLAQTPVPGLLQPMGTYTLVDNETGNTSTEEYENNVSVSYGIEESGSNDGNETQLMYDQEFHDALGKQFCKIFHIKSSEFSAKQLNFSSQSKGIVGSDNRKYVLELANTFPLDVNFAKKFYDDERDISERYPHRQTLLRPELVEKWWLNKVEKENIEPDKAIAENMFSYNPDAFQKPDIVDPVVQDMSDFLTEEVIPSVVQDYLVGNMNAPYNGEHLIETLHLNGINVRYLGKFIEICQNRLDSQRRSRDDHLKRIERENEEYEQWEQSYLVKVESLIKKRQDEIRKYVIEGKDVPKELTENLKLDDEEIRKPHNENPVLVSTEELLPLIKLAELEITSRSIKHILRALSKNLSFSMVPPLVAHVFNLLFDTSYDSAKVSHNFDKGSGSIFDISTVTRDQLVDMINREARRRYRFTLPSNFLKRYQSNPYELLRSICYKFGIQMINKMYFFSREAFEKYKEQQDKKIRGKLIAPKSTFSPEDFIIIPRVKASKFSSQISDDIWQEGASRLDKSAKEALTLLAQSLAIKEDVNSILHVSVAEKYLSLSSIYSKLALLPEAIAFCRKACMIYERVCGIDSFEMLRALFNLAVLEINNESPYNASLVYQKIVQNLATFSTDTSLVHPVVTGLFNTLEQAALAIEDPKLAIHILSMLNEHLSITEGTDSLALAYNESKIGNLYASLKEFRPALNHIALTQSIFTKELGSNHVQTAQSKQWINGLSNLLTEMTQKQNLAKEQTSARQAGTKKKSNSKKATKGEPILAEKSVDELLDFIEGDAKKTKGKQKSK